VRLTFKLSAVLLLVAVLPVAVSGVSSVFIAKDAVKHAAADSLDAEARHLAELAETTILGSLDDLKQASLLGLDRLSPAEQPGALWLIYRGDASRTAVALLNGKSRDVVTPPVFQQVVGSDAGLADHEAFSPAALEVFASHVPLDEALAAGKAVGVPYVDVVRGAPFIVLAVRVPGPQVAGKDGVVEEQPWVVAVELSLRRLNERFVEAKDEGMVAALTDLEGRAVCHTDTAQMLKRAPMSSSPAMVALFSPDQPASGVANLNDDGDEKLLAWARLGRLAGGRDRTWGVVVERDRSAALSAVTQLQRRVLFWVAVALVLAVMAGLVLARGLVLPIEALTNVVNRFGRGDENERRVRATVTGNDEIAALATTFNGMADQIEARDRALRAFNDELQQRVDERTAELKDAQNQLIDTQKMAAVGELGAGVAHEINNPLAAVLGSAQLALLRSDKADTRVRPHLEDIEKEALRIKDIVESLLKLSQDTSQQAMGTVDLNAVVEQAVALMARPIIAARIQLKKELQPELPRLRGRAGELQQALVQLLLNAKEAMPDGGTLTIRTDTLDGKLVRLVVEDTGQGVAANHKERAFEPFFTTRAGSGHKGMGLAIVHRIVADHAGRVVLESAGAFKGCTVRLSFPASQSRSLV
jgi:two-component system NtrC family sensor kinase